MDDPGWVVKDGEGAVADFRPLEAGRRGAATRRARMVERLDSGMT
jgi:hypothetical protein